MKKGSHDSIGFREILLTVGGLLLFGVVWIFDYMLPRMDVFDLILPFLIPFAIIGIVWRVIRFFHIPDEQGQEELPWAERVRQGLEPLEGSDQPKPEEMPWAERVRLGLESLNLEEEPSPGDHDHIPSTALEKDEKLEQLKVLLEAGLIDREEYEEKRREIKKDT